MYAIPLGDDGAELRPVEPWQAEEFLAHVDRGREFIGQYNGLPDVVTDLESSRAFLQAYAEKARPTPDGSTASGRAARWSARSCCGSWTSLRAPPRRVAGWSRRRWARDS